MPNTHHRVKNHWHLAAVTEEQVEQALNRSEELWNQVLDLREKADKSAEKAETIRASAENTTEEGNSDGDSETKHDTAHLISKSSSLSSLGDSMEADQFVKEAEELISEADSLEFKAKKALEETEMLLEQHLKDFPDSPLAQGE
jgi:predicted nucleotidyltransferase